MKCVSNVFNDFYSSQVKLAQGAVEKGKSLWWVGINGMGKNILASVLQDSFSNHKVCFISFKDRLLLSDDDFWLVVIQSLHLSFPQVPIPAQIDSFSTYEYVLRVVKSMPQNQKLIMIWLDFQGARNLSESVFDMLRNLSYYSNGKLVHFFLSEPHCLWMKNKAFARLVDRLINNSFEYMPLLPPRFMRVDIGVEAKRVGIDLKRFESAILTESHGLHGMMKALVVFLQQTQKKTIKQVCEVMKTSPLFSFWITEILESLPPESRSILKTVTQNKRLFTNLQHSQAGKLLVDLFILKPDGELRHPLFKTSIQSDQITTLTKRSLKHLFVVKEKSLEREGLSVVISRREKITLGLLMKHGGKTLSFDDLATAIWSEDEDGFSLWAVSQLIARLRSKLKAIGIDPKTIQSVRGLGYRWKEGI